MGTRTSSVPEGSAAPQRPREELTASTGRSGAQHPGKQSREATAASGGTERRSPKGFGAPRRQRLDPRESQGSQRRAVVPSSSGSAGSTQLKHGEHAASKQSESHGQKAKSQVSTSQEPRGPAGRGVPGHASCPRASPGPSSLSEPARDPFAVVPQVPHRRPDGPRSGQLGGKRGEKIEAETSGTATEGSRWISPLGKQGAEPPRLLQRCLLRGAVPNPPGAARLSSPDPCSSGSLAPTL